MRRSWEVLWITSVRSPTHPSRKRGSSTSLSQLNLKGTWDSLMCNPANTCLGNMAVRWVFYVTRRMLGRNYIYHFPSLAFHRAASGFISTSRPQRCANRAAKTPLQERGRAAPAPPRCSTPSGATGTASSPEPRSPVPPPPPRAAPQGREPSRSAALPPTPQPPARSAAREGRPPPSCPHKGTKAAAPLPRAPSRAAPAPQPRRPFPRRPTHLQAQRGTAAPQELADVAQALALRARLRVHLEEKRRRLSADPAPRGAARPPLPHLPLPPLLTGKGLNREVNTERRKWRARAEGTAHSPAAAAPVVQRGTGAGAGTRGAERGRRLAPGLSESGILGGF